SYFARRIACSAARSSTDNFTVPPPVSDHQILHVMQPSAIVDLNQGTLAFKAIAGASFVGHRGRLDLPHGAIARTPSRKLEGRAPASWGAEAPVGPGGTTSTSIQPAIGSGVPAALTTALFHGGHGCLRGGFRTE